MQDLLSGCGLDRRRIVAAIILLLGLAVAMLSFAQDSPQSSMPSPTPIPQPTPIPGPDIPALAAAAADTARRAVANAVPDARLVDIQQGFPAEQDRIETLQEETSKELKMPGPASIIKESEKSWIRMRDRLERWLSDLSARSTTLDERLGDLQSQLSLWRLTRDHSGTSSKIKAGW